MSAFSVLPDGYRQLTVIDLEKDKKVFWSVNLLSLALAAGIFVVGILAVPLDFGLDASDLVAGWILPFAVLFGGAFLYIFLHEAVHGIFMYAFSRVRPHFGFRSVFVYAGSNAFFDKKQYIIIALAPVVIWGMVLLIVCLFCQGTWFWAVYFIQILNVSGAAGDLYVTLRMSAYPKDILVQDTGTCMTVYTRIPDGDTRE